jgi:heat shock protein HtpX
MAGQQRVSFFDAIDSNKRNSLLLILVISALFMAVIWFFSYFFHLRYLGLVVGFIALIFYAVVVYFAGDRIVLAIAGARKVTAKEEPFLYNVVEGLAIASGIPVPEVYVINDPAPNAFATGRDPKHASVAVTTGLLQMMKREELEGVVAHEIAHIGNYDIRFMMLAVVFAGAIALLADLALRMFSFGFGRGDDRRSGKSGIIMIIGLLFLILAPIFATLVRLAISRQREYLADASAAKLTRYPEGLASALEKITAQPMRVQNATEATASLYISNPLPGIFTLFSTHPDPKDRVRRLRAM